MKVRAFLPWELEIFYRESWSIPLFFFLLAKPQANHQKSVVVKTWINVTTFRIVEKTAQPYSSTSTLPNSTATGGDVVPAGHGEVKSAGDAHALVGEPLRVISPRDGLEQVLVGHQQELRLHHSAFDVHERLQLIAVEEGRHIDGGVGLEDEGEVLAVVRGQSVGVHLGYFVTVFGDIVEVEGAGEGGLGR